MKIAARFPVKSSRILGSLIVAIHSFIIVLAIIHFSFSWQALLVISVTVVSFTLSLNQVRLLTSAPDDLCWSGENWLIRSDEQLNAITYLQLLPQSWMSSYACVLHFAAGEHQFQWLFTRQGLGDRSYSELCFLVKQNIAAQQKNN